MSTLLDISLDLRKQPAVAINIFQLMKELISGRANVFYDELYIKFDGPLHTIICDFSYDGNDDFKYPTSSGSRCAIPVLANLTIEDYYYQFKDNIDNLVNHVIARTVNESQFTRNDVANYTIDWNKWHETVSDSLHAFSFDDAADDCRTLGLTWFPDDDGEPDYEVKAGDLQRDVEQIIDTLIKLYELHWDGKNVDADESGYRIFTKCTAYVNTDGQMYALLKLKSSNDRLADPCIEVRLVSDSEHGIPWFEINLVTVGQFF
jgi:hypothetical protein